MEFVYIGARGAVRGRKEETNDVFSENCKKKKRRGGNQKKKMIANKRIECIGDAEKMKGKRRKDDDETTETRNDRGRMGKRRRRRRIRI